MTAWEQNRNHGISTGIVRWAEFTVCVLAIYVILTIIKTLLFVTYPIAISEIIPSFLESDNIAHIYSHVAIETNG